MSKLVTVKLEDGNFLTWKQQVLIAIRGYGLEDFIIGDSTIPPQFIVGKSGAQVYNPDFVAHQRQNQLLTSWLLPSIIRIFFLTLSDLIQLEPLGCSQSVICCTIHFTCYEV